MVENMVIPLVGLHFEKIGLDRARGASPRATRAGRQSTGRP
jgi:hypothetical protein